MLRSSMQGHLPAPVGPPQYSFHHFPHTHTHTHASQRSRTHTCTEAKEQITAGRQQRAVSEEESKSTCAIGGEVEDGAQVARGSSELAERHLTFSPTRTADRAAPPLAPCWRRSAGKSKSKGETRERRKQDPRAQNEHEKRQKWSKAGLAGGGDAGGRVREGRGGPRCRAQPLRNHLRVVGSRAKNYDSAAMSEYTRLHKSSILFGG